MEEARSLPIQEYADNLRSCYEALVSMEALIHLDNSTNLLKLGEKLPGYLQSRWRSLVLKLHKETPSRRPAMVDLVEFTEDAAMEANDPVYGLKPRKVPHQSTIKGTSLTTTDPPADVTTTQWSTGCPVCERGHEAIECGIIRRLNPTERMKRARDLKLCFSCLKPGHRTRRCRADMKCKVSGCQRRHATLLHNSWASETTGAGQQQHHGITQGSAAQVATSNNYSVSQSQGPAHPQQSPPFNGHIDSSHFVQGRKVALPIVVEMVRVPDSETVIETYALLHSGSTHTFLHRGTAE